MRNKFIELKDYPSFPDQEMIERSENFREMIQSRRTVREYSTDDVPFEVIKNAIEAASRAPSGANQQPWHFAIIRDPDIKKQIRKGAEKEEQEFYSGKAPDEWLEALAPLGTDEHKPFLETAPYLIVIFEERFKIDDEGNKHKNYYTKESVGIACGMLITALHNSGIATLTHTPSPMDFLNEILGRPKNEKPYLILVAGYPKKGTLVPDISKKTFSENTTII